VTTTISVVNCGHLTTQKKVKNWYLVVRVRYWRWYRTANRCLSWKRDRSADSKDESENGFHRRLWSGTIASAYVKAMMADSESASHVTTLVALTSLQNMRQFARGRDHQSVVGLAGDGCSYSFLFTLIRLSVYVITVSNLNLTAHTTVICQRGQFQNLRLQKEGKSRRYEVVPHGEHIDKCTHRSLVSLRRSSGGLLIASNRVTISATWAEKLMKKIAVVHYWSFFPLVFATSHWSEC
jgi:hypothetical protein